MNTTTPQHLPSCSDPFCPGCWVPRKPEVGANSRQVGGDHYQTAIQPWDFIIANGLGFLEGNAIAYICRHGKKDGKVDLEKAIHYLQKAIEVYYDLKTS